jgi:cytochrome c
MPRTERRPRLPIAVLALLVSQALAAAEPPPSFAVCLACHTVAAGAPSREGPNLHGVVGRVAGSYRQFAFSAAMKASGIVWTAEELDRFLASPAARVPGTSMTFMGVDDPAARKDIIEYLKSGG